MYTYCYWCDASDTHTASVTTVKTSELRAYEQIILMMRFEEADREATERFNLAYVRDKLRVLVKTVMILWFPYKCGGIS